MSTAFVPAHTSTLPASLTFANVNGITIAHLPNRIAIGELDQVMADALQVEYEQDFYDVVYHGSPSQIASWVNGQQVFLDVEAIVQFLLAQPDFGNQPVRLVACSAGHGPECVAQWLANRFHVEVLAPTAEIAPYRQRLYFAEPGCWKLHFPRR